MSTFRARYGASPLHLLLTLASFALTGYAGIRLLDGDEPWMVVVWFLGAALLHDLVLLPLYTIVDRTAQRLLRGRGPAHSWINYVRIPVLLSGVLLLTYFPLILGQVDNYTSYTGLPDDGFLSRWLLITAALFGISALWLLVRMGSTRPAPAPPEPTPGPKNGPTPGPKPGPGPEPGPDGGTERR